jgi:hypothetical protein
MRPWNHWDLNRSERDVRPANNPHTAGSEIGPSPCGALDQHRVLGATHVRGDIMSVRAEVTTAAEEQRARPSHRVVYVESRSPAAEFGRSIKPPHSSSTEIA